MLVSAAVRLTIARMVRLRNLFCALAMVFVVATSAPVLAATALMPEATPETEAPDPEPVIEQANGAGADAAIADRIEGIFAEIDSLSAINVAVADGVVTLSGNLGKAEAGDRAVAIAQRVAGVVTVETDFDRDLSVDTNVAPVMTEFMESVNQFISALPLIAIAIAIGIAIGFVGHLIASIQPLWRRIAPNVFLAELLATFVRVIFIAMGLFVALDILNATAVLGAVLGGAGILTLAIGFALRDTVENYVSSIMLSIRQPFRAKDHVLIGDREGRVVRLTSRATILMTLDGNHLRIPNSAVFSAEILNYTRNPERRFVFELGVDADDDPGAAVRDGLEALNALDFVIDSPPATAEIREVGDSNIIIAFMGWIDQRETDFLKARGAALRVVKIALEEAGFALPEPIYRLRFDGNFPATLRTVADADGSRQEAASTPASSNGGDEEAAAALDMPLDVSPETHVVNQVDRDRAEAPEGDLLDHARPVE